MIMRATAGLWWLTFPAEATTGGFAVSTLVFCFWADGRSPKLAPSNTPRSLRIKFEERLITRRRGIMLAGRSSAKIRTDGG